MKLRELCCNRRICSPASCAMMVLLIISSCKGATDYPALRDSMDNELQNQLMAELRSELPVGEAEQIIKAKRVSAVVVDITQLERPRVAAINGDSMLYAASLPKIAILAAAFIDIDNGRLKLDDELRRHMTLMIRESSNQSANWVLHRVGIERVNQIMQSDKYRLYDPKYGGGLWVGRDYGGGNVWKRDPVNGISHGASAMQVARLYYLLLTGRLVSKESMQNMLEILSASDINHKFVAGLSGENPDAVIFRKSGTWKHFHADSGIVVDKNYQYIVVSIIEHEAGEEILERGIGVVDEVIEETEE
jgi:beta-lactamase class A